MFYSRAALIVALAGTAVLLQGCGGDSGKTSKKTCKKNGKEVPCDDDKPAEFADCNEKSQEQCRNWHNFEGCQKQLVDYKCSPTKEEGEMWEQQCVNSQHCIKCKNANGKSLHDECPGLASDGKNPAFVGGDGGGDSGNSGGDGGDSEGGDSGSADRGDGGGDDGNNADGGSGGSEGGGDGGKVTPDEIQCKIEFSSFMMKQFQSKEACTIALNTKCCPAVQALTRGESEADTMTNQENVNTECGGMPEQLKQCKAALSLKQDEVDQGMIQV